MYLDSYIVKSVPKAIRKRTQENMDNYNMGLYDAFDEAVRNYKKPSKELYAAFYNADYRLYIPSAYRSECLDFNKYPLKYSV